MPTVLWTNEHFIYIDAVNSINSPYCRSRCCPKSTFGSQSMWDQRPLDLRTESSAFAEACENDAGTKLSSVAETVLVLVDKPDISILCMCLSKVLTHLILSFMLVIYYWARRSIWIMTAARDCHNRNFVTSLQRRLTLRFCRVLSTTQRFFLNTATGVTENCIQLVNYFKRAVAMCPKHCTVFALLTFASLIPTRLHLRNV